MDGFRMLAGATCIAVLAAVGYFFWGEYEAYSNRVAMQDKRERARNELFELAKAEPHETEKVRQFCKLIERMRADISKKESSFTQQVHTNCVALDYN